MKKPSISIFWFRRDLRLDDNRALFEALKSGNPVLPIFIFDTEIINSLPKNDHRVSFIFDTLNKINDFLRKKSQGPINFFHGKTTDVFKQLTSQYNIFEVYANHDYEPYAKKRDQEIKNILQVEGISFNTYKDQVIFEKDEVVKKDGKPYVVYTPYKNKWREKFNPERDLKDYSIDNLFENFYKNKYPVSLSLSDIGFEVSDIIIPKYQIDEDLINSYFEKRDYPSLDATSHVGPYLRFGLISIRSLMKKTYSNTGETFMNELIWREFFMQVMWHFPYSATRSFRQKYDFIPWNNNPEDFEKWKNGQTGYPLVDAGMRELNKTGHMHNRVRMVVASFLCKHLLIDWRWGEAYFAEKLFDYELSSNVGNWQWAAGSGVDAAPYFRVFNPETQMKKFDKEGNYVRKWVPEYFGIGYVHPMIEHKFARERAIETYRNALNNFEI